MRNGGKLLVTRFVFSEFEALVGTPVRTKVVCACVCPSRSEKLPAARSRKISRVATDCAGLTRAGTAWRLESPNWKYQRLRFPDICILAQPAGSGMCRCGSLVCIEMRPTVWAQARAF